MAEAEAATEREAERAETEKQRQQPRQLGKVGHTLASVPRSPIYPLILHSNWSDQLVISQLGQVRPD
jgi:hypothetical protein